MRFLFMPLMFSSILLGPWWGLLIGAASDALGFLIFDRSGMGFYPQITAIYAAFGFLAYFIFKFVKLFKNKTAIRIIVYGSFALLLSGITIFLCLNNEINLFGQIYLIQLWEKILVPSLGFGLFVLLIILCELLDKKFTKLNDSRLVFTPHQICFSAFIIEIVVMVLFGTLMKACAFGFATAGIILLCQLISLTINVPINTIIVSYVIYLTKGLH